MEERKKKDKLKPSVFGVGYLGYGKHKAHAKNKKTPAYKRWCCMIARCYDKKDSSYKYYGAKGVTVCDEWLCFQNFAEWFYLNYPSDGKQYQIDKDLKIEGNKTYSPETCCFVSQKENLAASKKKTYRVRSPYGDVFEVEDMKKFCEVNNLNNQSMCRVVNGKQLQHKGWTAREDM